MRKNQIIPGLMLCGVAALLLPAFRQAQDPGVIQCAGYMSQSANRLTMYAMDWDEILPTWTSDADLENKLRMYQYSISYTYNCPVTRNHYLWNSAVKGLVLAAIPDPRTFEAIRDSTPHPDGLISIGYVDGHVLHGGGAIGDPTQSCINNVTEISWGIRNYIQDYDETLPLFSSSKLESSLIPYVRTNNVFTCPVTGINYKYNQSLGGNPIIQYTDRANIWLVTDGVAHPSDGRSTIAFLDSHVFRPGWPHFTTNDNNQLCVAYQSSAASAILLYASDYDEILPNMTNAQSAFATLKSYLRYDTKFNCPQTNLQFIFNTALSGQPLSYFGNLNNYWLLTDASPHPDGQRTTAYLSGATIHPGYNKMYVDVPECIKSVGGDLQATIMYAQDYDEVLPPMHSSVQFDMAVSPYVRSSDFLTCPITNHPYLPSSEYSGLSYNSIQNPTAALIIQDYPPHPDGRSILGYLDGHVSKKFLPRIDPGGTRRSILDTGMPIGRPMQRTH